MSAIHVEPWATAGYSWVPLPLDRIRVPDAQRTLDTALVAALHTSFALLGGQLQLQPIVVNSALTLIDGAHRLAAARNAGWSHIGAMVLQDVPDDFNIFLAAEANRVRKPLGVLEMEHAWRVFFEPKLRAEAHERQLAGLRRTRGKGAAGMFAEQSVAAGPVDRPRSHEQLRLTRVIGNSNNQRSESVAAAAKRITGFSLDTLDKVAQIRQLAVDEDSPASLRIAAQRGLEQLALPGVGVDMIYRRLLKQRDQGLRNDDIIGSLNRSSNEAMLALERLLSDAARLAERVRRDQRQVSFALSRQPKAAEELRAATRSALNEALVFLYPEESAHAA